MTSVYIMAPLMIGMVSMAEPLVRLVLTDKWLPCVPYLRIFCITYLFWPIHTANLNAINAMGRSDLFLKLEIIKKIVGVMSLLITVKHGVMGMAYSQLLIGLICQVINAWPNSKLLNYRYIDQLKDIMPGIALAALMGGIIYPMCYLHLADSFILIIQLIFGIAIYLGFSMLFKNESFFYIWRIISQIIDRKKSI